MKQNPFKVVSIGSSAVALVFIGLPTAASLKAVSALCNRPLGFRLICAVSASTSVLSSLITRALDRPLQRKMQMIPVYGLRATINEALPPVLLCTGLTVMISRSSAWLPRGALAGCLGVMPCLLAFKPWKMWITQEEFEARSQRAREVLREELLEIVEEINERTRRRKASMAGQAQRPE